MGLAHTKEEAKLSDWNSAATEEVPELYKFLQNPDASSYLALLPHELLKLLERHFTHCGSLDGALAWEHLTIENCVHHGRYVLSVDQVKPRPGEVQRCARARDLHTGKIVWSSQYHVWMRAVCVASGGLVYTLAGSTSSSQLAGHVWRPPQEAPVHSFSLPSGFDANQQDSTPLSMVAVGERVLIRHHASIFEVSRTQPTCAEVATVPIRVDAADDDGQAVALGGARHPPPGVGAPANNRRLETYSACTDYHGGVAIWIYKGRMVVYFLGWQELNLCAPVSVIDMPQSGHPAIYKSRLLTPDGAVYDLGDLSKPVRRCEWHGGLKCLPSGEPCVLMHGGDVSRLCVLDVDGRIAREQRFTGKLPGGAGWCVVADTLMMCVHEGQKQYVQAVTLWCEPLAACRVILTYESKMPQEFVEEVPSVHAGYLVLQSSIWTRCYKLPRFD